jgi:putative transposase
LKNEVLPETTFTYRLKPDPKEPTLRVRLKELDATRVRYGYNRLTVLLLREGWLINRKQVYRLDTEEGLERKRRSGPETASSTPKPFPVTPQGLRSMRTAYGAASI